MSAAPAARPSYRPFAVEVESVADVSPTFRRLTLVGPDLAECGDTLLDQRVKVLLGAPVPELFGPDWYPQWRALPDASRPVMRTYTLSAADRAVGRVSIDLACRPAHGPASVFAAEAGPGTGFVLVAPDALSPAGAIDGLAWRPGGARDVLLVGDETALPAIRNILATLPSDATGQVVLELPHASDAVELVAPAGVRVDVVERDSSAVGRGAEELLSTWFPVGGDAAPERPARPDEDLLWEEADAAGTSGTYAWCAGEAGWIATLRQRDRARRGRPVAVARRAGASAFMGYWRAGAASLG